MPEFKPLRFHTYHWSRPDIVPDQVISPPYDVLSQEDIQALGGHGYNVVHIDSPVSYEQAREILDTWLSENVLVEDELPRFYLLASRYTVQGEPRTRWGVLGGLKLEPFGTNIFPHEETYPQAKEDRLRLMEATQGQLSPIFGVYDDPGLTLEKIGEKCQETQPMVSFYQEGEVFNQLWPLPTEYNSLIQDLIQEKKIFIADGHHRYETALHFMQIQKEQGQTPWEHVFIYLSNISSSGLDIFPYHRMVSREVELDWDHILERASQVFEVHSLDRPEFPEDLESTNAQLLCLPRRDYLLIPRFTARDIFDQVGAYVLDKYLLRDIIGWDDEELATGKYIFYTHDYQDTLSKVRSGELQAAFFLRPVPMSIMQQACEAGRVMPRKSTYFYPKLPTGMLFYLWGR